MAEEILSIKRVHGVAHVKLSDGEIFKFPSVFLSERPLKAGRMVEKEEYLAFVQEYAIDNLLDFGWMKNAFIIDYLAERMIADGHTNGYIASYDGYTRNLDSRGLSYSFNLFDRLSNDIYLPAVWEYDTAMSIVFLRNYPMSSRDAGDYYLYSDKTITHGFIDPADGFCRTSTDNLVSYGKDASCADLALKLAPVFVGETLNTDALAAMAEEGIYSVWFDGGKLFYNQPEAKITVQEVEGAAYQAQYFEK